MAEERSGLQMEDFQSTDGSLFSRETDEEKSLESHEDLLSMIDDNLREQDGKDNDKKEDGNKNTDSAEIEHTDADKVARSVVKRKRNADSDGKHGNDKGNVSDASDNKEGVQKKKKKSKKPKRKNLNESTLLALEKYLKSGKVLCDSLEYEEVSAFASKIHRYSVERTKGRQGMLFQDTIIKDGNDPEIKITPIIMTKEDIAQERLYHQIYQKEEYHAVAIKFSKTLAGGAQAMEGPDFVYHSRTGNWLKRAAGLKRQYDPYEKDPDPQTQSRPAQSEESADDEDADAASVEVGEGGDLAPKRLTRRRIQMTRKKKRLERLEKETENFRILQEVALELSKQTRSGRTKKGITRSVLTDEPIGRIPQEIGGDPFEEPFPSLESTGLVSIANLQYHTEDNGAGLLFRIGEEPYKMADTTLPPVVARCGFEFQPRPLGLLEARNTPLETHGEQTSVGGPSKSILTNSVRARKSRMLMNALSNQYARRWAINEFFYSDLDREWYEKEGFSSDLAKLGLPINSQTRLTKLEWSLIRRKIRPRPRLFCKRFIAEQMKQRNRYRALKRILQQDPEVKGFSPIPIGTPVTAYDKRGHTIRRGRVLLHDPKKHNYLVQFEDREAGCQICLDSEVAVFSPVIGQRSHTPSPRPPPLYEPNNQFLTKVVNSGVAELVIPERTTIGERVDDMERELLINVIAVVTEAFERKKNILEALESCAGNSIKSASKHCSYLLANLHQINATLKEAFKHMQVLYGRVYGSPVSSNEMPKVGVKKLKLRTEIPQSKAFQELTSLLFSTADKIGSNAFSSALNDNKAPDLLCKDISGSTSLLLLASYLAETSTSLPASGLEKTTYSSSMDAALLTSLNRYANICLPPTPDNMLVGKKLEQECGVESKLKDLMAAVGMLRTEVALATDETRTFEIQNAMVG